MSERSTGDAANAAIDPDITATFDSTRRSQQAVTQPFVVVSGTIDLFIDVSLSSQGRSRASRRFLTALTQGQVALPVVEHGRPLVSAVPTSAMTQTRPVASLSDVPAALIDEWLITLRGSTHTHPRPVEPSQTDAVVGPDSVEDTVAVTHRQVIEDLRALQQQDDHERRRQLQASRDADEQLVDEALRRVDQTIDLEANGQDADDPLDPAILRVLNRLGRHEGFSVVLPARDGAATSADPLERIARASHFRVRPVTLGAQWWRRDAGPLLGFRVRTGASQPIPVALIPRKNARAYDAWSADSLHQERVDDRVAAEILPAAREITAPFDTDSVASTAGLAKFAFRNSRRDVTIMLVTGALIGLLGLLTPIITKQVVSVLIPETERRLIGVAGVGLVLSAFMVGILTVVQGFAVSRVAVRGQRRTQAAVWDRMMKLPVPFFRTEASGSMAMRVLTIDSLQQIVSATTVATLLAAIFTLFNFVLLFVYDAMLAAVALALIAVVAGATVVFAKQIVVATRDIVVLDRSNTAHITNILRGLSKIRSGRAEQRFFALHAERIRHKIVAQDAQQRASIRLSVFYASLTIFVTGSLYVTIGVFGWNDATGRADIDSATYVAFITAFNAILGATVALSSLIQPLSMAGPVLEGLQPILDAQPEHHDGGTDPGRLRGAVDVRNVRFRYSPGGPLVLDGVSLRADPGQFVAIVGPSGSGKSSVLRLVLGFEKPETGAVFFDDQPAEELDIDAVRQQLGVVLQTKDLMGGSILANLAGGVAMNTDEAWELLDAVGLGDEIRAMPMGLQTVVDPNGTTMSGGQIQRLLIGRALSTRPAVLVLDEATSALDDATQEIVSATVESLAVTRLVVAHRLSTIQRADRIVVIDAGSVVETGTFDELVEAGGMFTDLVRRQQL